MQFACHLEWNGVIVSSLLIEPEVVYRTVIRCLVEPVDTIEGEVFNLLDVIRRYNNFSLHTFEILNDRGFFDCSPIYLCMVRRKARGEEHGYGRVQRPRERFLQTCAFIAGATVNCQCVRILLEPLLRCLNLFRRFHTFELQYTIPSECGASVIGKRVDIAEQFVSTIKALINEFLQILYPHPVVECRDDEVTVAGSNFLLQLLNSPSDFRRFIFTVGGHCETVAGEYDLILIPVIKRGKAAAVVEVLNDVVGQMKLLPQFIGCIECHISVPTGNCL